MVLPVPLSIFPFSVILRLLVFRCVTVAVSGRMMDDAGKFLRRHL